MCINMIVGEIGLDNINRCTLGCKINTELGDLIVIEWLTEGTIISCSVNVSAYIVVLYQPHIICEDLIYITQVNKLFSYSCQ